MAMGARLLPWVALATVVKLLRAKTGYAFLPLEGNAEAEVAVASEDGTYGTDEVAESSGGAETAIVRPEEYQSSDAV